MKDICAAASAAKNHFGFQCEFTATNSIVFNLPKIEIGKINYLPCFLSSSSEVNTVKLIKPDIQLTENTEAA